MNSPHAIATGNAVIAAALEWDAAEDAWDLFAARAEPTEWENKGEELAIACDTTKELLVDAIHAHREAIATEHVQTVDGAP